MVESSTINERRFAAADGRRFMASALASCGVPGDEADATSEMMLFADLRGVDSHGIVRLPSYIARLKAGGINPRPQIRVVAEAPATALVDGDNGLGHLVMRRAAEIAIEQAAKNGVAWVGTRRSNHAGAGACYAAMPLARDMIGLYLAVANNNHMAPTGGIEALLGTNPIAIAIPTQDEAPIVLDIATTATSAGKIRLAADNGERLEEGLVMDRAGRPITDPNDAIHGLLLPIGGYKGFGLSLAFSLMGGALNGARTGRDTVSIDDAATEGNTGQAIMALNVASFGDVADFKRRVDIVARDIRTSQPMPGGGEVRYPGINGHRTEAARAKAGIPIRPPLAASLAKLASSLGIAPLVLGDAR
ncbi:MAG TPA: Ldh family oxidoreductase [Stellaceae bacterium]|nr:Ldh family oxidoreductase [Stellaceae bacterium]